jgi:hypothetical protein
MLEQSKQDLERATAQANGSIAFHQHALGNKETEPAEGDISACYGCLSFH